ncbi:MAG: hypothetical protein CSA62_13170 [Planctomycetota bacterium]|nr:MAG: hypothetical protein CSA62_13170 [Planctomycetota bacterium]
MKKGDKLVIKFKNKDLAGRTTIILIDNGLGDERYIKVKVNQNGEATAVFQIPSSWFVLKLNHPSAAEHAITIAP